MILSILKYLFSSMDAESKKQVLEQEYGMKMSVGMVRRVNEMCNISQAIKEIGIEEGRTQGIEKGIEKGSLQERISLLKNMIKNGVPREQIIAIGFIEEEIINVDKA